MKRPAFQFYPGDWFRDAHLRICSSGARGLWIDMLALMHQAEPYGHLVFNGKPLDSPQLARMVGESGKDVARWLKELEDAGVPSRTPDGVLYSRRMVRDEAVRNVRATGGEAGAEHGYKGASHGNKGGRPRGDNNPPSPQQSGVKEPPIEPPPSSSSSSSLPASSSTSTGESGAPAVDNPQPRERSSTSRPRATASERKAQAVIEANRLAAENAAPMPESVAKFVKPVDHFEGMSGRSPHDDDEEQPAGEAEELPWWEVDAEVKTRAYELDVRIIPGQSYSEYLARVFAAVGPGPWDQAQPPDIRERIDHYRATGGVS